ncbi:conserved hypothetical protein [Altererythrobacter sp. B11]|uniref:diguanylate cyclase n=1 Tax=Altererythrobacter sp. B11 TaxID=2060312 RepID=UPI000DC73044|nr:diguanylate cyclase [Altererythrobacter sp. B11]BBC72837.1 conserved hypothetical protein [Altererythrobacter sp. B11]
MRLATITNWAYGITVGLTVISAATMLLAADAQKEERAAVEQRYRLNKATGRLGSEIYALTDHARQFVNTSDPTYELLYRHDAAELAAVEQRLAHMRDSGATQEELATLKDAIRWADMLHDEQKAALAAFNAGDGEAARRLLFGPEYERELSRSEALLDQFRAQLDRRTEDAVREATRISALWRGVSEAVLAITGVLFLCVLYFIFKQRVLRPVVKLSDVVTRLAAQDYDAEPPAVEQIDEIGDITQAVRLFRENGLERQRLEAERDRDQAIRDLLSRMTQRMQGCDSMKDLYSVVERFMPAIAPACAGRLYTLDAKRNAMVEACAWLEPQHSVAEFPPLACWALRRGVPHRPSGTHVDIPCEHLGAISAASPETLCLPLTAQRETLGLLYLERRIAPAGTPEPNDVYLTMLAENIGLAIANLRLRDALRDMAMADPLTGLANRRQLDQVLRNLTERAAERGEPLSALMMDVDHFKRINDVYGHAAGDAVLREVSALLTSLTRSGDAVFRYGGEEFLLLLPGAGAKEAVERAEEIRRALGRLTVRQGELDLDPVTISIGVAGAPDICAYDRIISVADAALLHAKANGRDRVQLARASANKGMIEERRAVPG